MSPENNLTAPTSQKRKEANTRNAQKSTGPRTPEGKSRSRFNGLKHGLAAKVPVLPGEDPAEFQARVASVVGTFGPQNQVEFDLLERVAASTWSLERASRAEAAQISHKIRRHAIEREEREEEEAVALGQRLLWDARGPWQLYPHHPHTGLKRERCTSWSENPADPNNPALLVLHLERTAAGCRWLLDRWAELKARLEPGEVWTASDQFKSVRLLGKQPLDAIDDPEVTQIFLASAWLLPDGPRANPFAPVKGELYRSGLGDGQDDHGVYSKELKKRSLTKLTPRDAEAAREALRALVDRHTARLNLILARNLELAEAELAEAPARLAFDPSPEGERLRRYAGSAARLINQTLNTFIKVRKELATDSADSAELSLVPCPLSADELCVGSDPLSADELSVGSGSLSVAEFSVGSGSLSVAELSGGNGPLSIASAVRRDMPDSSTQPTPEDPAPDGPEASPLGLRTEPISESPAVRTPLSAGVEDGGEAESCGEFDSADRSHEPADARREQPRTEPKTDLMAGREFGKRARNLRDGAKAPPHAPKGWRQGEGIPDLIDGCWKDVTEKFLARAAAMEQSLAEANRARRTRKKQAKARTRKAKKTDTANA